MKTITRKYVQNQHAAKECKPIACDIPEFCRNNYFTGKLLTERDLTAEQRYASDKLRLHHIALHGWGVVCGLKVKSHPHCPELRVIVEPGLAVDSCGRFIRLLKEIEVELPKRTSNRKESDPCPPDEPREETYSQTRTEQVPYGPSGSYDQSGYGGYSHNPEPTVDLYFCLAYAESEQELMPAPFDECACGENDQKPNRICETHKVTVEIEKPEGWDEVEDRHYCEEDDCLKLIDATFDECPPPSKLNCVPLAVVRDHVIGDAVMEDRIDNSVRPLLRSTQFLEQIVHCIAKKVDTRTLTKIEDISWTHQGEYQCNDFMRRFISAGGGFEVTFGGPVRGITPRTFQAVAVRFTDPTGAGLMEVVPARVTQSIDRRRALLQIDPRYAQRHLDRKRFDLYLRLRTGHILDDNGLAVDGDLLARLDDDGNYSVATPTGDGVPGGLFESWIKVFTESKEQR